MAEIEVTRADVEQFMSRFNVRVAEDNTATEHVVTLSGKDYERMGKGYRSPEAFVRECFDYLLEREPKEAIMTSFDVSQISTFFPEFEMDMSLRAKG
ncbi:MAG: hypothetical protein ABI828_08270 [Actinomycetota bacterium]